MPHNKSHEDYGEFQPGIGKTVRTYEFRRRGSLGEIAVYDNEAAGPKPVAFAPAQIKTIAEAELWVEGLQAGLERGLANGRKHLQDEMRELLNLK